MKITVQDILECHSLIILMKRSTSSTSSTAAKKQKVSYSTFQQWKQDFDQYHSTLSWLKCEMKVEEGCCIVTQLKCSVCRKFRSGSLIGGTLVINGCLEQNPFALATFVIMLKANSMYMPCYCLMKRSNEVKA